jgi:hypothetical protein
MKQKRGAIFGLVIFVIVAVLFFSVLGFSLLKFAEYAAKTKGKMLLVMEMDDRGTKLAAIFSSGAGQAYMETMGNAFAAEKPHIDKGLAALVKSAGSEMELYDSKNSMPSASTGVITTEYIDADIPMPGVRKGSVRIT